VLNTTNSFSCYFIDHADTANQMDSNLLIIAAEIARDSNTTRTCLIDTNLDMILNSFSDSSLNLIYILILNLNTF
jgi:hypothetical protein